MQLIVISYLKFNSVSFISFYILDKIYFNSVYSDLDYVQTLINVNHDLRYLLFIFFCGSSLFIVNLLTFKILKTKASKSILIINLATLFIIFYILKTNNISIFFTVGFSIIVFVLYNSNFLKDKNYLKFEYGIYFLLICSALILNRMY